MKIFVTGISGFLGRSLTRELKRLNYEIGGMSRDEHKIQTIWAKHPYVTMYLGDILYPNVLDEALRDFKPDVVIHAAALKVIPIGEKFPTRFIHTNVLGTLNLIQATPRNVPILFVSSDKAVAAYNLYGVTKKAAESLVLNRRGNGAVRLGNVLGSTGSVLTVWRRQIGEDQPLTITDPTMTRFLITREMAVEFIVGHLGQAGMWIPKLHAYTMHDFLTAFLQTIGNSDYPICHIPVRDGEKYDEFLVSSDELHQAKDLGAEIFISPYCKGNLSGPYSSAMAPRVTLELLEQVMNGINL